MHLVPPRVTRLKAVGQCKHMLHKPAFLTKGASCAADLQPADVTLEAVEAVLFQVCDGMKGMIKPGKTLVRETIRHVLLLSGYVVCRIPASGLRDVLDGCVQTKLVTFLVW